MIIKGTGNLNNNYESNYLRMRDEQYEVRPNIGYTLSHNASRDARTSVKRPPRFGAAKHRSCSPTCPTCTNRRKNVYSQKFVSTVSFDVQDSVRSVAKASDQAEPADRNAAIDRLKSALPAVIGLALFLVALAVLRRELHAVTWHELAHDVLATPPRRLALALLFTALNYAILTGYDFLAFAYIGKRLSWDRIALASFLAYAIANNVGFAMLSGASVRYRFYTRWGVGANDLLINGRTPLSLRRALRPARR